MMNIVQRVNDGADVCVSVFVGVRLKADFRETENEKENERANACLCLLFAAISIIVRV